MHPQVGRDTRLVRCKFLTDQVGQSYPRSLELTVVPAIFMLGWVEQKFLFIKSNLPLENNLNIENLT